MPFPVWILIALAFFYFGLIFWGYSRMAIRPFRIRQREGGEEKTDIDLDKEPLTNEILQDFTGYLDSINTANKTRYRIGALGFFIAGLTAILSIFLE
jgi:hypothetical protein